MNNLVITRQKGLLNLLWWCRNRIRSRNVGGSVFFWNRNVVGWSCQLHTVSLPVFSCRSAAILISVERQPPARGSVASSICSRPHHLLWASWPSRAQLWTKGGFLLHVLLLTDLFLTLNMKNACVSWKIFLVHLLGLLEPDLISFDQPKSEN